MSEMCAVAIGNLVVQSCCHGDNGDEVTQEIVREGGVEDGWVGCTPERLYLLLSFRKIFGDKKWWAELFVERWGGGDCDVFTSDQLDLVGRVAEVGMCVCVCVCERERGEIHVCVCVCVLVCSRHPAAPIPGFTPCGHC